MPSLYDFAESELRFTNRDDYSFVPAFQLWLFIEPHAVEKTEGKHPGWYIDGVASNQWEKNLTIPEKSFRTIRSQQGTIPLRTASIIVESMGEHMSLSGLDVIPNSKAHARRMAIDYYAAACPDVEPSSQELRSKIAELMNQHCAVLGRRFSEAFPSDFKRIQQRGRRLAMVG